MKKIRELSCVLIALMLIACSAATEAPAISEFPTLTVSETPTDTPSATPTLESTPTPSASNEPDESGKIKLSISLYGSFSVKETRVYKAAEEYMRRNPDVSFDFRYSQGTYSSQRQEYTQKTIDDISRGSSADIMFIDELPSPRSFPAVNNMVDFEQLIEADRDLDRSDFFENILNAARYENGLYVLPLDFYASSYVMNKEYVNLLDKPIGEYKSIDYKTMMAVYEKALESHPRNDILYLDNTISNFGNQFLEALDLDGLDFESGIVNIYNEKTYELAEKVSKRPLVTGLDITKIEYEDFFFDPQVAMVFSNQNAGGGMKGHQTFEDAYLMYDDFAFTTPLLKSDFSGKNITFVPQSAVALSNNCTELDTAWDFIKFLLGYGYSESEYSLYSYYSFNPVLKSMFRDKWTAVFDSRYDENLKNGRTPPYPKEEAIENAVALIEKETELINKITPNSDSGFSALRSMYYWDYTDGKRSLQDTLKEFEATVRDLMQAYKRGE